MPTPLIAGNWKMNGLAVDLGEARALAAALASAPAKARVALCPPATLVARMAEALAGSAVAIGGQDCHAEVSGPFTGDISAEMLADAGAKLVIVGHSERFLAYGESNAVVAAKALAAVRGGLEPIICVGETLAQRDAGQALEVVTTQVAESAPSALGAAPLAVAYEPVWAIGTGHTPTIAQIEEMHRAIRQALVLSLGEAAGARAPILYGGSVKPGNAAEILKAAEVGGALVGGASLKAADFLAIIRAA
jgi:triosephosphate isomerase